MSRWWRWAAVAAWAGVIFLFSAQTGEASGGLSGSVVELLTGILPGADPQTLGMLIRKTAHMTEYAVLGALLAWALLKESLPERTLRTGLLAVALGAGYAITDEVHQLFVPGRAGQATDVLIDTAGVAIGVGVLLLVAGRGYIGEHVRHDGEPRGEWDPLREEQ